MTTPKAGRGNDCPRRGVHYGLGRGMVTRRAETPGGSGRRWRVQPGPRSGRPTLLESGIEC
jgi:hypothetical protein